MGPAKSALWSRLTETLPDPAVLVALGLLLVGIVWGLVRVRTRIREATDTTAESLDLLTHFREIKQGGGLSEDEYRLIKRRLTEGRGPEGRRSGMSSVKEKLKSGSGGPPIKSLPTDTTNQG